MRANLTIFLALAALLVAVAPTITAEPFTRLIPGESVIIYEPTLLVLISLDSGNYTWTAESDGNIGAVMYREPFTFEARGEKVWESPLANGVHVIAVADAGTHWIDVNSNAYPVTINLAASPPN